MGGKRAEARRADAAGDRVQGEGCPLSLGKKIFEFLASLDAFQTTFSSNMRKIDLAPLPSCALDCTYM